MLLLKYSDARKKDTANEQEESKEKNHKNHREKVRQENDCVLCMRS